MRRGPSNCPDPRTAPVRVTRDGVISPGFAGGLPHAASFDYSYDGTMRSFEQSLLRLGTDRIDVLLIHDAQNDQILESWEVLDPIAWSLRGYDDDVWSDFLHL